MTKTFINKDAQFIYDLTQGEMEAELSGIFLNFPELKSRLVRIADNIASLDERSAGAYSSGFRDGRASTYARSNLAKAEPTDFTSLEEALASFRGEVVKVPTNLKSDMKPELTADDLDLDL